LFPSELRARGAASREKRIAPLPERFESNCFRPGDRCDDEDRPRTRFAEAQAESRGRSEDANSARSAIIDQVNAGERVRQKIVDQALATLAASRNISR
jgi:hypothetical protein